MPAAAHLPFVSIPIAVPKGVEVMLETNIRLVKFGADLYLDVRCAEVVTQDISADLLERACGALLKPRTGSSQDRQE
jgi:hypothetical protein